MLFSAFLWLPMPVDGADSVKLKPDSVVEGLGQEWPMYCGVPFSRGILDDATKTRLVDDAGHSIPAQIRVMARWADEGSVRWLGVDFLGDPTKLYALEFGADVSRPDSFQEPRVTMRKEATHYVITTGPAQFVLPFAGALIKSARLDLNGDGAFADNEIVISNDVGDDVYVVDNSNRTATIGLDLEAGQARAEPENLESEGAPLHACIRREGWYVTTTGERVARHITRLHFFAGQSFVRIEHTFIFTENTDKLWFRDVGIRFRHCMEGAHRVTFDTSSAFDTECMSVDLKDNDVSVFMLQEKAVQFSRRALDLDQRYVIGRIDRDDDVQEVASGRRCGEWARVVGLDGAMTVAVRDFWQQFPKEIEVTRDALTVHLWSDRGDEELDVRLETLRKKWPTEWLSTNAAAYKAMIKRPPNALGAAKTHELMLYLQSPDADLQETIRLAHVLNRPVYCTADPGWLYRSEAMGPIYPRDVDRFPLAEGFMETWFDQYMKIIRSWGDYGFFDYGSGPHVWYRTAKDGPLKDTWIAYTDRYSGQIDYGFHTHLWRMYARSGQRKYLEYAEETNRHRMDICMVHWDSPKAYKPIIGSYMHGKYKGAFAAGSSLDYVSPYSTLHHQSGTDLRKLYWYYYLRDYRRASDIAKEYHAMVLKVWRHKKGPFIGTRPFGALKCLATLYQETGDPEVLAIGRERLAALIDLDSPQGITPKLATKFGKYGPKIAAVERWYEATGDKLAADALVRGATTIARTSMGDQPFSYYNCMARVLNRAYRITGNELFASMLDRNMRLAVACFYNPATGKWDDFFGRYPSAANNVYPMGDMAIGLDAITRCGNSLISAPVVQQTGRGRPVFAVFRKPEGVEVTLDVRGRYPLRPRVYTSSGNEVTNVQIEPFREVINSLDKTDHPPAVLVRIPAQQSAGTYILDAGIGGAPWEITKSSVEQVMFYALGGLSIGCGSTWKGRFYPSATSQAAPVTWFFQVPEGVQSFQLFRSSEILLHDADGAPVPCETEAPGWTDISVAPSQAGRLWSFRAQRVAFVELRGIPPFFAADSPKKFFKPDLAGLDTSLLGAESDYTFTDRSTFQRDKAWSSPDGGIVLANGRALIIDSGELLGNDQLHSFNSNEGTFELWLKPDWSSVYELRNRSAGRKLLVAGPWSITLGTIGRPNSVFSVTGKSGRLTDVVGLTLERGQWTHLAYQWYKDGEDFVMETYINGRLRNLDHERAAKQGPHVGYREKWEPYEIGKILLVGRRNDKHEFLDAVVDELRISNIRRYRADFTPDRTNPLVSDDHTLGLFHFDKNVKGITTRGREISAKLVK